PNWRRAWASSATPIFPPLSPMHSNQKVIESVLPRAPIPRGLLPTGSPCENDCPAVHALADHSSHQRLPGSAHRYGAHSDWSARNRLRREMVMGNRDTSDESAAEKKARDV